jgi:hypothetical protein
MPTHGPGLRGDAAQDTRFARPVIRAISHPRLHYPRLALRAIAQIAGWRIAVHDSSSPIEQPDCRTD